MLWACLGPVTEVTAVAGKADVAHLVLRHQTGVTSTVTTTQSAPEAAAGVTVFVWGEAGRSLMPAELVDSVAALRTAAAELIAAAAAGRVTHPVRRPLRPGHHEGAGRGGSAAFRWTPLREQA